jgi:hypothetical protein
MTTKPNILQRLNAVMKEVTYIQKEKKPNMRYSIVSHDVVTAKVRPAMVNHGVIYYPVDFQMTQVGNRTQLTCRVVFASIDDPNDRIIVDSAGFGIDDQDKGPGKAISYAVKYALLKALGLESGDDPDEDQEVVYNDADILTIKEFEDETTACLTVADLDKLNARMKEELLDAASRQQAAGQAAITKWKMRKKTLTAKEQATKVPEPAE